MSTTPAMHRARTGYILALDASTGSASLALLRGTQCVSEATAVMGASREDALFPALMRLLTEAHVAPSALDAVVCGSGPGGFTSLRIAAAVAKGLCHALQVPLYSVSSLALAAATRGEPGVYVVHSDALRGDRYCAVVRVDAEGVAHSEGPLTLHPALRLPDLAEGRRLLASGSGEGSVQPRMALLAALAEWREAQPVDLATWEPIYGRLAEAQVQWEAAHARPLPVP